MIPWLRLTPYLVAVALILGGGFYLHHKWYAAGQASIKAKWDHEKALSQAHIAELQSAITSANEKLSETIKQKLAADRRSNELAARLRERWLALDRLSGNISPTGTAGTSGVGSGSGDLTNALGSALDACQRDAIRLNSWIEWYGQLPAEVKPR